MKYASILLLAGSVARQTIQSAIVHFRERSVREDALAVPSGVLVTRLGQFDHILAIVEDPPKAFGRWIRLDPADHPGVLVTCHSIYALLFGHADWLVCEKKNQTPASPYFFSSDIFSLSSFPPSFFFFFFSCYFVFFFFFSFLPGSFSFYRQTLPCIVLGKEQKEKSRHDTLKRDHCEYSLRAFIKTAKRTTRGGVTTLSRAFEGKIDGRYSPARSNSFAIFRVRTAASRTGFRELVGLL